MGVTVYTVSLVDKSEEQWHSKSVVSSVQNYRRKQANFVRRFSAGEKIIAVDSDAKATNDRGILRILRIYFSA